MCDAETMRDRVALMFLSAAFADDNMRRATVREDIEAGSPIGTTLATGAFEYADAFMAARIK